MKKGYFLEYHHRTFFILIFFQSIFEFTFSTVRVKFNNRYKRNLTKNIKEKLKKKIREI